MPSQEQILSGIRKRFLEEFNKALVKDGKTITRRDLALSINMHPTQIARFRHKTKPTNPMTINIYLLHTLHGGDLYYIFTGFRKGETDIAKELKSIKRLLQRELV